MQRILKCLLLFAVIWSSCGEKQPAEKEEKVFWSESVSKPAHDVLFRTGKLDAALSAWDSLANVTGRSSAYADAARFGMMADYHLFLTKNNESTAHYIDSALFIITSQNLQKHLPRSYVGFLIFGGEMALRLGNYAKSNEYFFQAKQHSDLHLDPCERSGFTYNVAMVSYRQENYAQSAAYFKEAFASQATCPAQTTAIVLQQQEIKSNIGLCMVKLKQYDSALAYFNEALTLANRYKDSLGEPVMDKIKGVVYGNMAKVYSATNRTAKAEEYFKKSIALNVRPGYEQRDAMLNQVQLAEVYSSQGRLTEMQAMLQNVRNGLDTIPDSGGESSWLRLMATYYKGTNQPLEELRYFKQFMRLRDSLSSAQKQLVQADISRQLKTKEQEMRIAVLTRDNVLNRLYLGAAVSITILASIIIYLISQNNRRNKKNLRSLTLLNEQIGQQKSALEKANMEKDRILHVVAHDLRNPIGITAYMSDLILMDTRNEKEQASLLMIKEASQQALALTNELLGLKDTEEKKEEVTALKTLVEKAVAFQHHKAAEKEQKIFFDAPEDEIWVNGTPERLNRVVNNLLVNAIKFSPVLGKIFVEVGIEENHALLTVTDQGMGIPEEYIEDVFTPFTTARRRGTLGEKSFGLGLSICREIVESQGGQIELESTEDEGSIFYVRLPLAKNM